MPRRLTTNLRLLLFASLLVASPAASQIAPGDTAPDFTLTDFLSGADFSLNQFRGKVVVVQLAGYNCDGCIINSPGVEALWQEFKNAKVQFLALDVWNGTPLQVQGFVDKVPITYPILQDAGFLIGPFFFGTKVDNFIVIDPDGIVRFNSNDSVPRFQVDAIRSVIVAHLPVAVEQQSWGAVKGLFR